MTGSAFPRVQPRGAFGLQIADGAIDCLLDPLGTRRGNRIGDFTRRPSSGGRSASKHQRQYEEKRICEP